MTDSVSVSNFPDSGSPERVAFDLMVTISLKESGETKDRGYYLNLYEECLHVAQRGFRKGT